jgi:transcriptional regulator GlxA family with amidase domain
MLHKVGIVLFPDVEELDFAGPWEVFALARDTVKGECDVFTIAENPAEIRCARGLRVIADHPFITAAPFDVLIVPGGPGARTHQLENPRMIDFLRHRAADASVIMSVCTGVFLLEKAGLIAGKRVTTHWWSMDRLRQIPSLKVVQSRWVHDGNIITAAGISAGIDASLYLVGRLWDPAAARNIQKRMEYYPQPPYQQNQ